VRATVVLPTIVAILTPTFATADRGALTVELGPTATWWANLSPPDGTGPGVSGSAYGGLVDLRYALSNHFELSATGFYEAPASYAFPNVLLPTNGQTLSGTLNATLSRWGAMAGARYVLGFTWRLHLGLEVGLSHEQSTKLDLINVSNPSVPESYGLGLSNIGRDSFLVTPLVGVEWFVADRWSIAFVPRVELVIGSPVQVALVFPITVGYSWYLF